MTSKICSKGKLAASTFSKQADDPIGVMFRQIDRRLKHKTAKQATSPSDPKERAALILARAASPSPAQIDADIVAACRHEQLTAPAIVELVSWISVLQMLHRLSSYYVVP